MKILISSLGTRGDIQPYVALAVGLQQAGHTVTLAAPHTFAGWIETYGVAAHPLKYNPGEAMTPPEAQAALKTGNPSSATRKISPRAGRRDRARGPPLL